VLKSILNADAFGCNVTSDILMKGAVGEEDMGGDSMNSELGVIAIMENVLPLAKLSSTESLDKVVGGNTRRKQQSLPEVVHRSGRLMDNEAIPVMEQAEFRASVKSLEVPIQKLLLLLLLKVHLF